MQSYCHGSGSRRASPQCVLKVGNTELFGDLASRVGIETTRHAPARCACSLGTIRSTHAEDSWQRANVMRTKGVPS